MATSMPSPDQSSATPPQGQGGAGAASQQQPPDASSSSPQQGSSAPASDLQMLLARWYQTVKQMASSDPRLADGANDVANGIQKMQTALVTPQQPTQTAQQPSY